MTMRVLIVASYNKKRFALFIVEQARALQQALLEKAINYGKTKGHQHIIDMQLDNEQVAKRIVEIYKKILNV